MKMNLQNFSGIFQVGSHTYLVWGLSILSIPIWLTIIIFGIWATVVDFFDSTHSSVPQFFTIALFLFFTVVLPTIGLIIGLARIRQKPGVYFRGLRVSSSGIEAGTLMVGLDTKEPVDVCERTNFDDIIEGNWTCQKTIRIEDINILIELRTEFDARCGFFFERIDITSREEILYQLLERNGIKILWKDLAVLSNGSVQFLRNSNGVLQNHLFQQLGLMADAISVCRPSNPPSCTLKIVSSPISLNNVLAFGVLGGLATKGVNSSPDKNSAKKFPDKKFLELLETFLEEKGWSYSG
jgi:hypothetical protein